jgi:hypothetical protein
MHAQRHALRRSGHRAVAAAWVTRFCRRPPPCQRATSCQGAAAPCLRCSTSSSSSAAARAGRHGACAKRSRGGRARGSGSARSACSARPAPVRSTTEPPGRACPRLVARTLPAACRWGPPRTMRCAPRIPDCSTSPPATSPARRRAVGRSGCFA